MKLQYGFIRFCTLSNVASHNICDWPKISDQSNQSRSQNNLQDLGSWLMEFWRVLLILPLLGLFEVNQDCNHNFAGRCGTCAASTQWLHDYDGHSLDNSLINHWLNHELLLFTCLVTTNSDSDEIYQMLVVKLGSKDCCNHRDSSLTS